MTSFPLLSPRQLLNSSKLCSDAVSESSLTPFPLFLIVIIISPALIKGDYRQFNRVSYCSSLSSTRNSIYSIHESYYSISLSGSITPFSIIIWLFVVVNPLLTRVSLVWLMQELFKYSIGYNRVVYPGTHYFTWFSLFGI